MTDDEFETWMERNRLSVDAAAGALGLSRRMVYYYRTGEKPIPTKVALACAGYDAAKPQPPAPRAARPAARRTSARRRPG